MKISVQKFNKDLRGGSDETHTQFFQCLVLDGQTMAIPTWYIAESLMNFLRQSIMLTY